MAGNVKLMTSAGGGVVLDTATTTATDVTVKVPAVNGTLVYADGSGNVGVSGNLSFNSGYGSVATAYGCRAWVNFNGTGTVAIRASGNVSSITDNGVGDYTVNFTYAMPDANYAVNFGTVKSNSTARRGVFFSLQIDQLGSGTAPAAGSVRVMSAEAASDISPGGVVDVQYAYVSIFR